MSRSINEPISVDLIAAKRASVGVVGMGYVGLPLALLFARQGYRLLGFDIDADKVSALQDGRSYLSHIEAGDIRAARDSGLFEATTDFTRANEVHAVLLCVPTPLTEHRQPDMTYIERTCRTLAPNLVAGQLVCLESTSYPGTTREVIKPLLETDGLRAGENRGTVLFVDEVHRFNKAQQDAFLPHVEDGTLTFLGATTENPAFELNNALLSRARVYVLKPLDAEVVKRIIDRALANEAGLGQLDVTLEEEARELIARAADGDARRALNFLELAVDLAERDGQYVVDETVVREVIGGGLRRFDKGGDAFYDQISALHKSIRGSDPDASLYWFCRMVDGGCDPEYLARRLVRIASEDIGNADPRALQISLNAWDSYLRLGTPEGELALGQAVVYMACAAKSNAVYTAFNDAMRDAAALGSLEVPAHLRNAPTKLAKQMGHGAKYRYAHDEPDGYAAGENYFPEGMEKKIYYKPVNRGLEQKIAEKLAYLKQRDKDSKS